MGYGVENGRAIVGSRQSTIGNDWRLQDCKNYYQKKPLIVNIRGSHEKNGKIAFGQ
jgi:hypothetical protein